MKRFNVSILSIVAVLAVGLTAFTKGEPKAKRVSFINCYQGLVTQFTQSGCASSVVSLSLSSHCTLAEAQDEKKVSALSNFTPSNDCDLIYEVFCCAQIIVDPSPCFNQALLTFTDKNGVARINQPARIDAIHCTALD